MMRNLTTHLIRLGRIKTTRAKAEVLLGGRMREGKSELCRTRGFKRVQQHELLDLGSTFAGSLLDTLLARF